MKKLILSLIGVALLATVSFANKIKENSVRGKFMTKYDKSCCTNQNSIPSILPEHIYLEKLSTLNDEILIGINENSSIYINYSILTPIIQAHFGTSNTTMYINDLLEYFENGNSPLQIQWPIGCVNNPCRIHPPSCRSCKWIGFGIL